MIRTSNRRTHRSTIQRAVAASALGAVLLLSLPDLWQVPARAADEGIVRTMRWRPAGLVSPTVPNDLKFEAASAQRILYATAGTRVYAYNLDSLQPIVPPVEVGTADAVTVDRSSGDLVSAFANGAGRSFLTSSHIQSGALTERYRVDLSATLPPTHRVLGLSVTDDGRRAFLLSLADPQYLAGSGVRSASAVAGSMAVTSIDLARRAGEWSEPVPQCPLPVSFNAQAAVGYVASSSSVYFGCTVIHSIAPKPAVPPTGVGRLVIGPSGRTFELFPRGGEYATSDSIFDSTSGRLMLVSGPTSGAGVSTYVFDGPTNSWVGSTGNGGLTLSQFGFDARIGRLYTISGDPPVGLLAADVRATPVGQGRVHPAFINDDGKLMTQKKRIAVDEVRSRLFLTYIGHDDIVVAEDRNPPYVAPPVPDPDDNTLQVEERAGATGASFGGSTQGYGFRYRFVGGSSAMQFNVVPIGGVAALVPIGPGTREMSGAFIDRVGVRNNEAEASAIGGDRDVANTGKDLERASWPYTRARCIDTGVAPTSDEVPGAAVKCDAAGRASTSASSGRHELQGPGALVDLGSSATTSDVRLEAANGVVSRVTSTASDMSFLGGALRFGGVSVTASAQAHGRTGTAKSAFTRTVRDVTVNGVKLCTSSCEPSDVAAAVNSRFVGLLRVDFPTPDPASAGSNGGYQALVRARPEQQLEAVSLNEQPNDRIEVPGMVVTIFSDNTQPSRTILQFAGTAAEARYGIYRLDGGGADSLGGLGGAGLVDGNGLPAALDAFFGAGPASLANGPVDGLGRPGGRGPDSLGNPLPAGWAFLRNGLAEALPMLVVWSVLLAPVYLSARRRLLLLRNGFFGRVA